jgi:hypothetical protein
MLITNGITTRNIAAARLKEYAAKGYKEVKAEPKLSEKPIEKPKPTKKAKV